MPKKNNNTKLHIIREANNLFKKYEYGEVDMRKIAKNSNVAVGTLYNYFKGKEDLYISILKESWQSTYNRLDKIKELNASPMDKIYKFFEIMEEDKKKRKHLSQKIIHRILDEKTDCDSDKFFRDWIDYLDSKLAVLIKSADNKNVYKDDEYKILSHVLISSFFSVVRQYDDSKERNKFLKKYIGKLLS
jgi:AcrR family transcriptional regulator